MVTWSASTVFPFPESGGDEYCEQEEESALSCSRCGLVKYCSKDCQRAHWKDHKPLCIAKADRVPNNRPTKPSRRSKLAKAAGREECPICLDPLADPRSILALSCEHKFHVSCIDDLRVRGGSQVCPVCRACLKLKEPIRTKVVNRKRATKAAAVDLGHEGQAKKFNAKWVFALFVVVAAAGVQLFFGAMVPRSAEEGHTDAQFSLGNVFAKGKGVQQDYTEAVKWYHRAGEQGDAGAQFRLGVMYANGQDVQQNYAEAVKWYRRAAEQGDAKAQ